MERSVTIDIAAPAERVWQVMSDVERWPEWTPTVSSVKRLDEGPLRMGSRAKVLQPKLPEAEYAVTELSPGRSFTWVATSPGVVTTARHEIEPTPTGTRVRLSVLQAGWLGRLTAPLYRGLTDRYLANEASGLKAISEGAVGN